jgi:hypothetical protein
MKRIGLLIFSPGIYFFHHTTTNDIVALALLVIILPSVTEAAINALIAYVSASARPNLCQHMHSKYFSDNV